MKIKKLDEGLSEILQYIIDNEPTIELEVSNVHKDYKLSAKNLCRYLILRSFDLRKYHDTLSDIGLSSLRTAEGYVLSNLYNVVKNLKRIQGMPLKFDNKIELIGYKKSKKLLKKHANNLFNETRKRHFTEIMVTLPNEAVENKQIIRDMAMSGMEIARINLSHGNLGIWKKMVEIIHEVREETQQNIKIYMDLSGPKIRTSKIEIHGKKGKVRDGIPVQKGEHIILTKRQTLGKKSLFGKTKEQLEKAEVGVLLHEIIDDVKEGDVVLFDDGMIKSLVLSKKEDDVEVVITDCYKPRLSSHKGINLPNTTLNLPALTERDIELLPFICEHSDIIGYSFVRKREDVKQLYRELDKINANEIGVVFKIENQEAFENLPEILLEGMGRNKIGVMIARGDLAAEIGFERISEVQNQILWFCEAAHIPVIWATQVLENLAKTGVPTRAEISDAAHGAQAECVMLNKGPYINDAIRVLKGVLIRMEGHSFKQKSELRALNVAKNSIKNFQRTTMTQNIKEQKKYLRQTMLERRNKMPRKERSLLSEKICDQLWNLILEKKIRVIHSYLTMGSEVNVLPLLQKAIDKGITVVVPKTLKKRQMQNLFLTDLKNMEAGIFNTYHPKDAEEYTGEYDLIIVAGLAFDKRGYRVGYGGGYYDTFLAGQPKALKVGVCFPFQMIAEVPVESHDIKLDEILTING